MATSADELKSQDGMKSCVSLCHIAGGITMKSFRKFHVLLVIIILTGCQAKWSQPFPNADIVYQSDSRDLSLISFINSDGSNPVVLDVGDYLITPAWAIDGKRIYGLAKSGVYIDRGYPAYWESNGTFKECRQWFNFSQIEHIILADGTEQALIMSSKSLLIVDNEKCDLIEVVLDFTNRGELSLRGFSYRTDGQWLLYGLERTKDVYERTYQINKVKINALQEVEMVEGINPSWSSDGSQIAYVQADGIYVMNADGSQPRQLISHNFVDSHGIFGVIPPIPQWSPDGKWIVYHRCDTYSCIVYENTIYKVEVSSGSEVKLIYGGGYPDWKP